MRHELDDDAASLIDRIDTAYLAMERWQIELDKAKAELAEIVGDAEEVGYHGETIARASLVRNRGRFDRDRLKRDYPQIHDTYWIESEGFSRRFSWRPLTRGKTDYR